MEHVLAIEDDNADEYKRMLEAILSNDVEDFDEPAKNEPKPSISTSKEKYALLFDEKDTDNSDIPAKTNGIEHVHTSLLDDDFRKKLMSQRMPDESSVYPLILTTATISGTFGNYPSNVRESELLKILEPTKDCPVLKCNYGKKVFPEYADAKKKMKENKTRRGRPKKAKVNKKKKLEEGSNGKCMNSQLTFLFTSALNSHRKKTPLGKRENSYLIFSKGKIHMAGLMPGNIEEIMENISSIAEMINSALKLKGDSRVYLENLDVVNINYKFFRKILPNQFVLHKKLERVLLVDMFRSAGKLHVDRHHKACDSMFCILCVARSLAAESEIIRRLDKNPPPPTPRLLSVNSTGQNKLSITFSTPIPKEINKDVLVKISSGNLIETEYARDPNTDVPLVPSNQWGVRITFNGALSIESVESIYGYLKYIFDTFEDIVIKSPYQFGDVGYDAFSDNIIQEHSDEYIMNECTKRILFEESLRSLQKHTNYLSETKKKNINAGIEYLSSEVRKRIIRGINSK